MVWAALALAAGTLCLRESHPVPKNCPGTPSHPLAPGMLQLCCSSSQSRSVRHSQGSASCSPQRPQAFPGVRPAQTDFQGQSYLFLSSIPTWREPVCSGWGLLLHGDPQHFPNIKLAKERLFPGFKPGAAWSNPDQLYIIHGCLLTCSCFLAGVSTDPVKAAAVSPCRLRWLPPCQGFPKTAQLVLELPPFPQCSAPGMHSHHLPLSPCAERGPVLVPSLTRCPAASLPCSQTCSREAGTDPPKRLHS